jgi:protein-tyrosine phosphatase
VARSAPKWWNLQSEFHPTRARALARDLAATGNRGPISAFAVSELHRRSIPIRGAERYPLRVQREDLDAAHKIIAVSAREHAPMVRAQFPDVVERIHYFEIGDIDVETPAAAIARLAREINRKIADLLAEAGR